MLRAILERGLSNAARWGSGGRPEGLARTRAGSGWPGRPRAWSGSSYTSNPFYILSADLVFVGLRMSFGAGGPAAHSWALAMSLAGYTLLLATTACVLIRVGRLWDDLRSLLVLVVMMFLAIAMSCDDAMAADPGKGALGYIGGFLFAVVGHRGRPAHDPAEAARLVSAGLLRDAGAGVPVSGRFDAAAGRPGEPGVAMGVVRLLADVGPGRRDAGAGGPSRAGVPREERQPLAVADVSLGPLRRAGGGLCVRCSSLCVSFHYVEGSRTIFGPYFLVPIGLAVCLVWLEIGIASGRAGIMFAASALPLAPGILAMIGQGDNPVYRQFLGMFIRTLGGSPAYLALLATTMFLAYAARGVCRGRGGSSSSR